MQLRGAGLRDGEAEGPVVIEPSEERPGGTPSRIAAFGDVGASDPRLGSGWLAVIVAPRWVRPSVSLPHGPPMVGGIDPDVLRDGERIRLDGTNGTIDLSGVSEVKVVTSFLERPDGRVLLLRRSERVGSFRGRWAAVSGFLEDPTPEQQARREIGEETGIDPSVVQMADAGPPIYARDGSTVFTIHPFRFRVPEVRVTLDWEHTAFEWVDPSEMGRRETVPKLDRVWRAIAPSLR